MANVKFDPSKFTAPKAKILPVILLLDVSGSMSGEKILNLNDAVRDMLNTFSDTESSEIEIHVAIINFGAQVKLHQPLVSASAVQWQELSASGSTPLGTALEMAKAMIEDKDVLPSSRIYRPTVVLVSDGQPDSGWEKPLNNFISDGRSGKCDRIAMAIGADVDKEVLGKFFEGTTHPLLYAEDAKKIRDCFKYITMSVTTRTKSQTPNIVPESSTIEIQPPTIQVRNKSKTVTQSSSSADEEYL